MADVATDELEPWEKHLTPRGVAEFHLTGKGKVYGRRYESVIDVVKCEPNAHIIGLLQMLVEKHMQQEKEAEYWSNHRIFLLYWHDSFIAVRDAIEHQRNRITKLAAKVCCVDMSECDVGLIGKLFCNNKGECLSVQLKALQEQAARLRSVKTINDLELLHGMTKSRANRIRKACEVLKK